MITYIEGDLFTSQAQTLVNTVNTVGVMGKGLAKTFKNIYPEMFEAYRHHCEEGNFGIGRLLLYRTLHKWVLNFPTKRHWRKPSRVDDIESGLQTFCRTYAEQGIASAAFPQLGCGNGGLDWESEVRPLMERYLAPLPIDIEIFIPEIQTATSGADQEQLAIWLQGPPFALPFEVFQQELTDLVTSDRVKCWSVGEAMDMFRFSYRDVRLDLGADDLFELFRLLRVRGYLVPEDAGAMLAVPAEPVIALLEALPYVTRANVARTSPCVLYDECSTRNLLDMPEARAIRLIPPLVAEQYASLASLADVGDRWDESLTTSQLALFSTN